MAKAIQQLEETYVKNRHLILCEDGTIRTPLIVLREVAREYATPIHMEVHEVNVTQFKKVYQVEIYSGRLRGRGEAPRRRLAMQIASYDLLLKVDGSGFEIPAYGLLPGARINPTIFMDLVELCIVLELHAPMYVHLPNDPEEHVQELYTYKCQVGQLIRIGKSDSRFLAQRIAAKLVYEALTNSEVDLDVVKMGAECLALENYKIQPGTSQKKIEIMKYRLESRVQASEAAAGAANVEFEEDEFGDNMESMPARGTRGQTPTEVTERLGKLKLHDIKARVKDLTLMEEEQIAEFLPL